MAKPLSEKSRIIRAAIKAHAGMGNTELAEILNSAAGRKDDGIKVTAQDVNQQKQALKKLGELPAGKKKPGRKPGSGRKAAPGPTPAPAPRPAPASPADLLDSVLLLAKQCGGMNELKRLVDRLIQR